MQNRRIRTALFALAIGVAAIFVSATSAANAQPCLIFVHGKQTDTNTFTSYTSARNYWVNGSHDFVRTATKSFATPYYVVGYNGTRPYWEAQAAGEVANEIVNATNGIADGGGHRCTKTFAQGGTFLVVAHSMGGAVMDFILGNDDASDPNFNMTGPFDVASQRISFVITTGGAHRGSQGADAVCGGSNFLCNFIAGFIQNCDDATNWLRSADAVQVKTFSNAPSKLIYLSGGYEAIFGSSACLNGEDDGVVQYASIFACNGSATASYDNTNVCGNSAKQESANFRNLDGCHENHSDERDDSDSDVRKAIPGGIWNCGTTPCAPNTTVQSAMTTAQFISILY
ncbi:MAG TPA: hypothetical protein VN851_12965 [Thermoanaerobaculia bacterium]|nr:hypothetical protein [Thermoanaerobaculia bacterium]